MEADPPLQVLPPAPAEAGPEVDLLLLPPLPMPPADPKLGLLPTALARVPVPLPPPPRLLVVPVELGLVLVLSLLDSFFRL